MPSALRLVVVAMAAYRATWMLLGEDGPADIVAHFRNFIYETYPEEHWVARGFNCPYCISFWMSLIFILMPANVAEWFAASELARRLADYDGSNA